MKKKPDWLRKLSGVVSKAVDKASESYNEFKSKTDEKVNDLNDEYKLTDTAKVPLVSEQNGAKLRCFISDRKNGGGALAPL